MILYLDITWRSRRGSWLFALVFMVMMMGGGPRPAGAAESTPAPAFTLPSSMGGAVQLADYLGERPILLAFYMGDF